jgi:hypothetical protein
MNGPRIVLLGALAALALPSTASAADLVIKVRSKHVSSLGGFTVSYFWLYKAHDAFVGGDAPIVEAQMKGGAVHLIQVQVNAAGD